MKRWIASVLTACFLLSGAAMADGVLSDGWQEASTDALLNARTQISNQLRKSTQAQKQFLFQAKAWKFLIPLRWMPGSGVAG